MESLDVLKAKEVIGEEGKIASMLTVKIDSLIRSDHTAQLLKKNSVSYDRVKNVSETVIVGASEAKR